MPKLTAEQIELIDAAVYHIDTEYVEMRKGIAQTRYVIEVRAEDVWDGENFVPVPQELLGVWMQEYPNDNAMITWEERLGMGGKSDYKCDFVKAQKVEVVTYSYEIID